MDYASFETILNRHVFGRTLEELLKRLVRHPERFVGLFRPSTASEKILQNLTQAREIKFGDAMEEVVGEILQSAGYESLSSPSPELEYDHLYYTPDKQSIVLIEQKVRDDHDSTKRWGQFQNFEQKIVAVVNAYPSVPIQAIMYFLDPEFTKNRNFYARKMQERRDRYPSTLMLLFYGEELFIHLNRVHPLGVGWAEITQWLQQWRFTLKSAARGLDTSPEAVAQIARESPELFLDLAKHIRLWEEGIIQEVFPKPDSLQAACDVLASVAGRRRLERVFQLKGMITKYYSYGGAE
ncbi:MAG: hypothetical protein D6697_00750 [Armatimonadetes bacterium]|jgi:hypothetical protein|nr:MAG: hypothetical protein D6697_00750 [Armatimonadota bacterium]